MAFWITLIRGLLAIALGVALIWQPDKAQPMLINFMGIFWLLSGIASLRWGVHGERARGLSLLVGVVGVLAGMSMLTRRWTTGAEYETALVVSVGLIILLTGLMHVFGGFRTGVEETHLLGRKRKWSWTSFLLGLFEVVLGFLLVIAPLHVGPGVYVAASVWALEVESGLNDGLSMPFLVLSSPWQESSCTPKDTSRGWPSRSNRSALGCWLVWGLAWSAGG